MFSAETQALIPDWRKKKDAQWGRISGAIPGLQLARSRAGTQYMITCSTDAFYESVIIGQLPEVMLEPAGPAHRPTGTKPVADHKKPLDKRSIDLADGEIDQVLACWGKGKTAIGLPFVLSVWDRSGKMKTK